MTGESFSLGALAESYFVHMEEQKAQKETHGSTVNVRALGVSGDRPELLKSFHFNRSPASRRVQRKDKCSGFCRGAKVVKAIRYIKFTEESL